MPTALSLSQSIFHFPLCFHNFIVSYILLYFSHTYQESWRKGFRPKKKLSGPLLHPSKAQSNQLSFSGKLVQQGLLSRQLASPTWVLLICQLVESGQCAHLVNSTENKLSQTSTTRSQYQATGLQTGSDHTIVKLPHSRK